MWIPPYRRMDESLPDVGTSYVTVKRISPEASETVFAATDVAALASMRGYARTYVGPSGATIFATAAAFIWWMLGYEWFAVASFAIAAVSGYLVLEIRRRARKWETLVEARLAQLGAG